MISFLNPASKNTSNDTTLNIHTTKKYREGCKRSLFPYLFTCINKVMIRMTNVILEYITH